MPATFPKFKQLGSNCVFWESRVSTMMMQQQQCAHFVLHPREPSTLGIARSSCRGGLQQPSSSFKAPRKDVRARIAAPEKPGLDLEVSGLKTLSEEARERSLKSKTKQEKVKVEKCGSRMWTEVHEMASLIREGKTKWEDLSLDDIDIRFKWAGLFHRAKRTPKKFMMRIKVPSGELNADQLRFMGSCIEKYGDQGCGDITTRAAIQLRGLTIEDADYVQEDLMQRGLTAFQTGMDNVRNLTGSPIAGLDPYELIDVRPLLQDIQDMITNHGRGNRELCNLPRKINICISPSRDDFPHTQINDVGFEAVHDPELNQVVYNLVVGGYFSLKRNMMSVPTNISVTHDQMVPFNKALLEVFRDFGPREDRQKARMIWLVEALGEEKWKELIEQYMGGVKLRPAVKTQHEGHWERRDVLGVHDQKQPGLCWVGACVPSGRLLTSDFFEDGCSLLAFQAHILLVALQCWRALHWSIPPPACPISPPACQTWTCACVPVRCCANPSACLFEYKLLHVFISTQLLEKLVLSAFCMHAFATLHILLVSVPAGFRTTSSVNLCLHTATHL
ncbi:hypothetical protein DUNSADRAFT_12794 [Dunaliella salina]|uniref:Uncharacterized protein n=1 Tax=Dunaliella salina TaxID=3046 RepID=A0ABQ7GAL0_DUNSA|nr:hypothetical protein DUNSADRAFT_12794 [Dunaliella salina]|eukprot:KAF5831634.1 hypothetical protein DUNSADRAFT_12794 [Dunaliella salina]